MYGLIINDCYAFGCGGRKSTPKVWPRAETDLVYLFSRTSALRSDTGMCILPDVFQRFHRRDPQPDERQGAVDHQHLVAEAIAGVMQREAFEGVADEGRGEADIRHSAVSGP